MLLGVLRKASKHPICRGGLLLCFAAASAIPRRNCLGRRPGHSLRLAGGKQRIFVLSFVGSWSWPLGVGLVALTRVAPVHEYVVTEVKEEGCLLFRPQNLPIGQLSILDAQ